MIAGVQSFGWNSSVWKNRWYDILFFHKIDFSDKNIAEKMECFFFSFFPFQADSFDSKSIRVHA